MRLYLTLMAAAIACSGPDAADPPDTGDPRDTDTTPIADTDTDTGDSGDTGTTYVWLPAPVVLPDVIVVDALGARGPLTMVLDGDRIDALLELAPPYPSDAVVLDVAGTWVTPGLIDPHVHLTHAATPWFVGDPLRYNLRAFLAYGVTSVVDVGGPLEVLALRDRIAAGEILGPSVKATGPFVTTIRSHPCEIWNDPDQCWFASDATEGAARAEALVAAGTDGIKIALADAAFTGAATPRLDLDAAAAALAVFDGDALRLAHVDTEQDALDALDAGADVLAHPPFDEALSAAGAARIAMGVRAQHTTVSAFAAVGELLDGTTDLAPLDGLLAPEVLSAWQDVVDHPTWLDRSWRESSAVWADLAMANLAMLDAAGATLVPASDAGYWFVAPGLGLHRELEALQELGWTPAEILTAATAGGAAAGGWDDRGRVEAGLRADLLVLDSDPSLSIAPLRAPRLVVVAGSPYGSASIPTLDPLRVRAWAGEGGWCLDDRDCSGSGTACDRVDHVCRAACDPPYRRTGVCDDTSWCAPADGLATTPDAACHVESSRCDWRDPAACAANGYGETCVPADLDTSYCWPSGGRLAGRTCNYTDPDQSCAPGLFCSWIDFTCYTLCDPEAPVCPTGETCVTQVAEGEPWFGLCL